ncbi:MAG: hypothetical protein OEU94_13435 [Aquincola sp.]|nr:hypothetical protein [Aquincola sp.]MDH4290319.1 hypothetical protein [Aquincola sp.]MDH5331259.1 hypothetical protein [Aquincola sp.]
MAPQSLAPARGPLLNAAARPDAARRAAAAVLQRASRALASLAQRLAQPRDTAATLLPQLEFHAEAGAPEGALYADGVLVALLPGVTRL